MMSLEITTSRNLDEFRTGASLLEEAFQRKEYYSPDPGRIDRLIGDWQDRAVAVLQARRSGVGKPHTGTVALLGDGPKGLPIDEAFQQETDQLRAQGKKIVQFTCLAVDEDGGLGPYILQLFGAGVIKAYEAQFDTIVAVVNPKKHGSVYQRLNFSLMAGGESRPIPSVQNCLGIGIYQSVTELLVQRKTQRVLRQTHAQH